MTNEEAKIFLDNLKVCIEEHPIVADWLVEIADRKTENSSEKPNNCEECKHWNDTEDGCADRHGCKTCRYGEVDEGYVRCAYYSKSTEPTTEDWQDWKDKMWSEAVVTEPQTE